MQLIGRPLPGRIARGIVRRWTSRVRVGPSPWSALERELSRWPAGQARFWWRDDDAVAATAALDRLLALRNALDIPLALAVIPATAEVSLATRVNATPPDAVRVLLHGWDHRDHGGHSGPKAELSRKASVD
jgi:hypothetical protein